MIGCGILISVVSISRIQHSLLFMQFNFISVEYFPLRSKVHACKHKWIFLSDMLFHDESNTGKEYLLRRQNNLAQKMVGKLSHLNLLRRERQTNIAKTGVLFLVYDVSTLTWS